MPNKVAISRSEFTSQQQVQEHQGSMWRGKVSLPQMKRENAEDWLGFLAALHGRFGTFLIGDPNGETARGVATGTPLLRNRANLLIYSEQFDNVAWADIGTPVVTANTTAAPDGATTADTIEDNDGAGLEGLEQDVTVADDSVERTFSVYLKEGTAAETTIRIEYSVGTPGNQDATITWAGPSIVGGTLEDVGGGWYRAEVGLANDSSGNTTCTCHVYPAGLTASATGTVIAWGAQLEENIIPGSYIQTEATNETGESATGHTLYTDGWTISTTGILLRGDYFQLGTGEQTRMYKLAEDSDSDLWGNAALEIWPRIRDSPVDDDPLDLTAPKGTFRLATNDPGWSLGVNGFYTISFPIEEAI